MNQEETIYDIMPIESVAYVPHVYVWYALLSLLCLVTVIFLLNLIRKRFKLKGKIALHKEITRLKNIKNKNLFNINLETLLNNLIFLSDEEVLHEYKEIKKDYDKEKYANKNIDGKVYLKRIEEIIKR